MQKLGCPESFTEPVALYHLAQRLGMEQVTITDHNVIDGALEIAHLPNTFIGCEYTTYFPEDRCKAHVLVYQQTEAQHRELTEARENIFDLVEYLHQHRLPHICAHPLFWVNDRLTLEHVEKLVLLFKNWEWNGDICPGMNSVVRRLVEGFTAEDIERLANTHGFAPLYGEAWKKNLTAGSDDHSSLHLARSYTEVPNATTLEEFWSGVEHGQARVRVQDASPQMFARNVYAIAYQFYKGSLGLERYVHRDILLRFLDRALQARHEESEPWLTWLHLFLSSKLRSKIPSEGSLLELARTEAEKLILQQPQLMALVRDGANKSGDLDGHWFEFVNQVSNRVLAHFGNHLLERLVKARLFDMFHSIGSAGSLYVLLAPYFVSFSLFTKQRQFAQHVFEHFQSAEAHSAASGEHARVAHFTDTFHDVNGVARTLQQEVETALELGKDYTVITCHTERIYQRGVRQFMPVGSYRIPEYPELNLLMPPFLQMLSACYEEQYTHLHVSTPGPVGLAALGIARVLNLPISGTYHTAFPQYIKALTEDSYVEDLAWKYMLWFYNQLDAIYVPSRATGAELVEKGIAADKIHIYPRGVDTQHFHPSKRNGFLGERFGMSGPEPVLLYVGRISKEKNVHRLAQAFALYRQKGGQGRLAVAGDGPFREEMEAMLAGKPVAFTGYLEGEDLARLYASCSVFVFPSSTDTFGNVVLEAQASGLPVIVTDQGGPSESILPGRTGLVVEAGNVEALAQAMLELTEDEERREAMGRAARAHLESRGFEAAFEQLWTLYTGEEAKPEEHPPSLDALFDIFGGKQPHMALY